MGSDQGSFVYLNKTFSNPETDQAISGNIFIEQEDILKANLSIIQIYAEDGKSLLSFYRQNLKQDRIWVIYEDKNFITSGNLPLEISTYFELYIRLEQASTQLRSICMNKDLIHEDNSVNLDAAA